MGIREFQPGYTETMEAEDTAFALLRSAAGAVATTVASTTDKSIISNDLERTVRESLTPWEALLCVRQLDERLYDWNTTLSALTN